MNYNAGINIEDIRFYDFEFNLLHIENQFISSNWSIYYNKVGTFEAHFDINSDTVPVIMNNPYLVAVQGDKTAIVTGRLVKGDLTVYGRTVNWILTRRATPRFGQKTGTVEALVRDIVKNAFSDVENFVLGAEIGLTKEITFWRNTLNPTFDVVSECLDRDGAGHRVIFDIENKKWVFEILMGGMAPILISESNKNAYDSEFSEDFFDYYSCGWYEKEQEADENGIVPDPVWTYIEKDSLKGIYRWECALTGTNESEGVSSLKTKGWNREIKLKTHELVYKTDYNLGDTVRVQAEKGSFKTTQTKQISGVNIWYENNNIGQQPILEEIKEEKY